MVYILLALLWYIMYIILCIVWHSIVGIVCTLFSLWVMLLFIILIIVFFTHNALNVEDFIFQVCNS